ncbi:hypothetical protein EI94DRAFT_824157 [Lactarius quietus]|nr:hypothetical protein EI94DRAFT_824157 [Lactarius quietus]
MVTVFLLGATGYIGGAILAVLVKHFKDLQITALVRKKKKEQNKEDRVDAVRKLVAEVVEVDPTDKRLTELVSKHARAADITINAAGSDDIALTNAILAGQKARVVEDKKEPAALLHTSGVAVFAGKERNGRHDPGLTKWNDGKEEDIRKINETMVHGQVDVLILAASEEGYTTSYIICPGAIVGPSVTTASLFFRFVTELALDHKRAIYIGEGTNVFYAVYLDDLMDLYRRVFERILIRDLAKESPYTRYYLGTSTPLVWKDIATTFGVTLHEMGKIESAEPQSISLTNLIKPDELKKAYIGASQSVQAERAKALGWEPRPVKLEVSANDVNVALQALEQKKD